MPLTAAMKRSERPAGDALRDEDGTRVVYNVSNKYVTPGVRKMSVRVLQLPREVKALKVTGVVQIPSNALQQVTRNASRLKLITAFAAVYLIWGSTYVVNSPNWI
jgi:hypothetical protein